MAHTVQTLSKLLKKTSDEVINILANAGIDGKTADSEISAEERKILMGSLSKRSTNKSSMSVSSRKPSAKSSASAGGVKVQVKKKRVKKEAVQEVGSVDNEAALKAQAALDAGRDADEKLLAQDAKRQEMTRLQKDQAQAQKDQQAAAKQKAQEEAKKPTTAVEEKKPKRLHKAPNNNGRRQLHVARHNPNRKLKKKDRTRLSQKTQEGFFRIGMFLLLSLMFFATFNDLKDLGLF